MKLKKEEFNGIEFMRSSGNVFADLKLPNAEELLYKAELTRLIKKAIDKRKLTQTEAGKIIGLNQADVSRLLRGRMSGFSVDRLFEMLNSLGYNVEVRVVLQRSKKRPGRTFVNTT